MATTAISALAREHHGDEIFACDISPRRGSLTRRPAHFSVEAEASHRWRDDVFATYQRDGTTRFGTRTAGSVRVRHMLSYRRLTLVDGIGWLSSLVLLATLGQQVRTQWVSRDSRGVSIWLFVGQLAASIGFSLYSFMLGNWVFVTTNLLLVVNALLGQWVTLRNRRHSRLPGV